MRCNIRNGLPPRNTSRNQQRSKVPRHVAFPRPLAHRMASVSAADGRRMGRDGRAPFMIRLTRLCLPAWPIGTGLCVSLALYAPVLHIAHSPLCYCHCPLSSSPSLPEPCPFLAAVLVPPSASKNHPPVSKCGNKDKGHLSPPRVGIKSSLEPARACVSVTASSLPF